MCLYTCLCVYMNLYHWNNFRLNLLVKVINKMKQISKQKNASVMMYDFTYIQHTLIVDAMTQEWYHYKYRYHWTVVSSSLTLTLIDICSCSPPPSCPEVNLWVGRLWGLWFPMNHSSLAGICGHSKFNNASIELGQFTHVHLNNF